MGTNYYLHHTPDLCPHCGRTDVDGLHIDKSSAGWCFTLHVIPERNINSLEDWKREFSRPNVEIRDEYGRAVTVADMLSTITERFWKGNYSDSAYQQPRGPNGLLRHVLGDHCVGHGEGTWDLVPGEFS